MNRISALAALTVAYAVVGAGLIGLGIIASSVIDPMESYYELERTNSASEVQARLAHLAITLSGIGAGLISFRQPDRARRVLGLYATALFAGVAITAVAALNGRGGFTLLDVAPGLVFPSILILAVALALPSKRK